MTTQQDLDTARRLARHGVPVFVAYPDSSKSTGYGLPIGWQTTSANPAYIDAWKPGLALCAVMGHGYDVIDIDPRNGGDGSQLPVFPINGVTTTPSGGEHWWIPSLSLPKRTDLLPGIDYQGGTPEGGRSFVFIPPTTRASRATGELAPYRWASEPQPRVGLDPAHVRLANLIRPKRSGIPSASTSGVPSAVRPGLRQSPAYVRAALVSELDRVAYAKNGTRNSQLFKSAAAIGRFVASGELDAEKATDALMSAAQYSGLDGHEAFGAIRNGFRVNGVGL
jgi:hypothetical protein